MIKTLVRARSRVREIIAKKVFRQKKAKKQVEQNRWLLSCATIVKNQSKIVQKVHESSEKD